MSKFTITVDDAQIERFILNMLSLLKNNPGINFRKEGNNFVITTDVEKENLMLAGEPLTWEELVADITKSEEQYQKGEFLTSQELKDNAKSW